MDLDTERARSAEGEGVAESSSSPENWRRSIRSYCAGTFDERGSDRRMRQGYRADMRWSDAQTAVSNMTVGCRCYVAVAGDIGQDCTGHERSGPLPVDIGVGILPECLSGEESRQMDGCSRTELYSQGGLLPALEHSFDIAGLPAVVPLLHRKIARRLRHRNSECAQGISRDTSAASRRGADCCSGQTKGGCLKDNMIVHSDSWPLSVLTQRRTVATQKRGVKAESSLEVAGHIRQLGRGCKEC